jgi:hypothetical protein
MGPRVEFTLFDSESKLDWLNADLTGMVYIAMATLGLFWLAAALFEAAGLSMFSAIDIVRLYLGEEWTLTCYLLAIMLPGFLIVFVFRRNFAVLGPRRQFRYICRWF